MRTTMLLLLGCLLCACVTTPPPVIEQPYPKLDSANRCLDFFKLAARVDDPQAGYHCLSERTKELVTFSDFVTGWAWYREYFELFGRAKVTATKPVRGGQLLTLELLELREPFLFVEEAEGWRLRIPSRYNRRTLEQLFDELKAQAGKQGKVERRQRPARRGG